MRVGYVPTGLSAGLAGVGVYEYRIDRTLSAQFDITGVQFPSGLSFILGAGVRLRFPFARYNKNIYGMVGFGSGSRYPVLYAATGIEFGITERTAVFFQYRTYTPNFDYLKPNYGIYSLGLNIDITPTSLRESYLMEK
jgi:hypothetical protein